MRIKRAMSETNKTQLSCLTFRTGNLGPYLTTIQRILISAKKGTTQVPGCYAHKDIPHATRAPIITVRLRPGRRSLQRRILTRKTSSMMLMSRILGMKPAPMPSIWWYPGRPPDSTGLSVGSTATSCTPGLRSFK
jgi:hypothetical protein